METNITQAQMDRILSNLKATRMVIGHNFMATGETRSPIAPAGDVIPLFHGKVWMIDTGIGYTLYGGRLYALIVNGREFDHYAESEEATGPPSRPGATAAGPTTAADIEAFLRQATPAFVMPAAAGRTDPWKVRMDLGDLKRWAQFKYIDRPRPDPLADSYRYELAAYELDKYLGLGFVPPVVERTINNYPGSLQIFVDDAFTETTRQLQGLQLNDPNGFDQAMDDLKVFLNIAGDQCGTERNRDVLIQRKGERIYAVDFSRAFGLAKATIPGCEILRCSRRLHGRLLEWDKTKVRALLAPYLSEEELRALESRWGSVLQTIRTQIETRGERAVLF
jgi:hypothetical protein